MQKLQDKVNLNIYFYYYYEPHGGSNIPDICQGRQGRCPCKFFLPKAMDEASATEVKSIEELIAHLLIWKISAELISHLFWNISAELSISP